MYNGVAISPAHRTYTRTIVSFPFHSALLAMMIHSTRCTNEWENGAIFIRCDKHVMFSDSSTFIAFFRLSCVRTLCVRVMIVQSSVIFVTNSALAVVFFEHTIKMTALQNRVQMHVNKETNTHNDRGAFMQAAAKRQSLLLTFYFHFSPIIVIII